MMNCWTFSPAARPSFEEVKSKLGEMLDSATEDYGYLRVEEDGGTYVMSIGPAKSVPRPVLSNMKHIVRSSSYRESSNMTRGGGGGNFFVFTADRVKLNWYQEYCNWNRNVQLRELQP